MKDKALMELILSNPRLVREKLLTDREIELVREVKRQGEAVITSHDVALRWDVSIQNASNTLSRLHKKGYLKRTNRGHDSGGGEFIYEALI